MKAMTTDNPPQHYACPMHPEIVRDIPGICPECGMRLIVASSYQHPASSAQKKASSQHDKSRRSRGSSMAEPSGHAGHSTRMFLKKFWVSLMLTIPVVLYSEIAQSLIGWQPPQFIGSQYLPLVFGSAVLFYGGGVFLIGAWRELKARLPGMMTLIGIAISAAYFYSVYAVFGEPEHTLFWELTSLITIMLLGHWLEMRAVSRAQGALKELSKLLPDTAEVIRNGKAEMIPLSELREGDIVFVRPGGRIPSDGIVTEGESDANEAVVTGESAPVAKSTSSEVIAGTINGDGSLKIKVTKVGERTFLSGIIRLVREAQASKSRLQILSDRAAFYLTATAVGAGGLAFALWLAADAGFGFAIERLVAVLVIACPHALGLAVPLVASISTTLAARNGFLVRKRLALEAARNVDVVLFDKTGTLTKGEYGVTKIIQKSRLRQGYGGQAKIKNQNDPEQIASQFNGASNAKSKIDDDGILQLAASVDSHSEHFIAKAIASEAKKMGVPFLEVKNFQRIPGKGVKGVIGGAVILVGGEAILEDTGALTPREFQSEIKSLAQRGQTIIFVLRNNQLLGAIACADIIRDESRQAIRDLKAMGVKVAMITGDSEGVARWVAEELGIDEYFSKVLPAEKAAIVKKLQKSDGQNAFGILKIGIWNLFGNWKFRFGNSSQGPVVAMVGDGVNDAPALTQADLGIAIGAGTNVAIESAGIILVRNDPRDIVKIIKLSRLTYTKMVQNLFWATGYNIVALPLAAGVLASRGILLQPALAALFMSLSTVIVAINAMLLRKQAL